MAIKFAVETIFKSRDKQSANFNKMGKNAKRFGETTSKAFKKASGSARSFNGITRGILQAGAIQKSLAGVSRGIASVTTDFLGFDNAITAASAKFKGLDLATKAGQKTLQDLRKTARLVGRDTEFNAAQAAGGLDFLALAGFNAQQAMKLLPGVANLATVAGLDLATATDIASDSLGAFGLMTKNTAQLQKNFTRIQDVMAKTTATSNTSLTDLFEAVKKGAPSFTAAGQTLETFSALAGEMANSGVKGAESGTQLRNVMLRLANPTKKSSDLMTRLGIKTSDAKGNFLDVVDILADFEKGLKGMGTEQRAAALATVFGARSVTGISILLKTGTKQLRSYRQALIDSQGASEKMATIMRSSLMNRLKSLGSALTEVGFQFFDAFADKGADAIEQLTIWVRRVNLKPLTDSLKIMASATNKWLKETDAINKARFVWEGFTETITEIKEAISGFVKIIKSNIPDSIKQMDVASKDFKRIGTAIAFVFTAVIGKALIGLLIAGGPIALFIVAISAIALNWDAIAGAISGATTALKEFFNTKDPAAKTAADNRKALEAVNKIDVIDKKVKFKEGGLIPSIIAKVNPEFASKRSAELSAKANAPFAEINKQLKSAQASRGLSPQAPPRQPPNRVQVETNQRLSARVGVRFENAPEGTTAQQESGGGAIPVDISGLGDPASLQGL